MKRLFPKNVPSVITLVALIILVFINSCKNNSEFRASATDVLITPTQNQDLETITPDSNQTVIKTIDPAPIRSTSLPTMTSAFPLAGTQTLTPLITLNPTERSDYIKSVLGYEDCKLPCIFNVDLGKTTWQELRHFFSNLGVTTFTDQLPGNRISLSPQQMRPGSSGNFLDLDFEGTDQVIDYSHLTSQGTGDPLDFNVLWASYSLENILYYSKIPSSFLINVLPFYFQGKTPYSIWVFYQNEGFAISYNGYITSCGETCKICPSFQSGGNLAPEIRIDAVDPTKKNINESLQLSPDFWQGFMTIDQATGMSLSDFYNKYGKVRTPFCFETPVSVWNANRK